LYTIPPYDEPTLIQQVAEGNETAFRKLVHQYADVLGSHIYRITHDREQSKEIVQDVFLKIWQTRESLIAVRNFRTYLYVVSRNQALNAIRSVIRERIRRKKWEQSIFTEAVDEDEKTREQQLTLIDKAISALPAQQQKAWLLSRREGLRYKDIAKQMNLSPETVKKYIQYASLAITRYIETHTGIILIGLMLQFH